METKIKIVLDLYKDGKITAEQATVLLQRDVEYQYLNIPYYQTSPFFYDSPSTYHPDLSPDHFRVTCSTN